MSEAVRVLIVYHSAADRTQVQTLLARSSLAIDEIRYAEGLKAAIDMMQRSSYDVILVNLVDSLPADAVSTIEAQSPNAAVILLTSVDDEQAAAVAIGSGAQDCLPRERIDPYFLSHAVRCALERKRMEQAIRTSEARLRNIIEHSTNMFYSHTPDHTLTYASPQVKAILGYTPDEFRMRWTELITDNPVNEKGIRLTEEAIRTGQAQAPYELEVCTKDEQKKWLEIHEAPVIVDGRTVGIVGAAADITSRKQAQEALHDVSSFRNTIITNAAEGLCVCHEVSDHPRIVFTVWNDRMTEITGYSMAEVNELGLYPAVFPDPCVRARVTERMARMRQGEDLVSEEWVLTRSDGQERTVLISTSTLVSNHPQIHILAVIQDITQRKVLEKQVQDQLHLLQTLIDAMPNPVYYKDAQLRYLGCNRAFAKLLGATKAQIVGRTIHDVAPKDLADRYHAADMELLTRPGFQTYEGSVASADGTRRDAIFHKATFQNSEGQIGGIVGVVTDTTELARAEQALLVKDSALNSAISGIVLTDLEGKVTYANPACLRMWGFDHEHEVLGKPFMSVLRCEQGGSAAQQSTIETGAWYGELAAQRKDGSEFVVQVSASRVSDKQGKPVCLMASLVDVTESRRLRDILDRKQRNLEAIFDAAPLGMLLVNEQRRVVRANDPVRQISGKEYREILNQHPCQVLACAHAAPELQAGGHPACQTCSLANLLDTTFESGSPVHGVEARPALNRDGEHVRPWFSISLEPVNVDGHKHVLIALHDITGRKEAEEQLRETMEMKSQFISTVSHELRTPLAAMNEAVIIVADGIAGKLNKDQTRFLDMARRNIERLGRLIDDVLDFQKLSADKMRFDMQPNQLGKTIEEAYGTMLPQSQQKQLDLSVDLEPNLPPIVYDHDRMIQVLTNLLSNAIKFTPEGGRVALCARRRGDCVAIGVRDTGMGIPPDSLPRIFTQFYRVHRPGKEIKGTGLGLAIVQKIVAAHGGRIEVESELDKGTTFTVLLPLTAGQSAGNTPQQADACLENTLTGSAGT